MKLFNSKNNSSFFIAEIGSAHEGSFLDAIKLVNEACKSNADCVKIQIYKAEKLVAKKYDLKRFLHFKKMELKIWQYIVLAKICKKFKKLFCASIWDKNLIFKCSYKLLPLKLETIGLLALSGPKKNVIHSEINEFNYSSTENQAKISEYCEMDVELVKEFLGEFIKILEYSNNFFRMNDSFFRCGFIMHLIYFC
jgi:hypothetical protein